MMAKVIGTQEEENKMGRLSWFQPVKLILFVEIFHKKKKQPYYTHYLKMEGRVESTQRKNLFSFLRMYS